MSTLIERFFILAEKFAEGKHTNLAKLADIPKSTFQGYINGRPPHIEHLLRIREHFNINLDWLLAGEGQMLRGPEVVLTDDALKLGEWDEDTRITTDRSDPYRWHGQSARTSLEARSKEQAEGLSSLYNDMEKDPEAADLLTKTWQIIKSNTGYSASLAANIRSFHQAMTTENRLNGLETQFQDIGNIVKDLVDECKEIKERLNKSDSKIRQEDPEEIRGEILKKRAM